MLSVCMILSHSIVGVAEHKPTEMVTLDHVEHGGIEWVVQDFPGQVVAFVTCSDVCAVCSKSSTYRICRSWDASRRCLLWCMTSPYRDYMCHRCQISQEERE